MEATVEKLRKFTSATPSKWREEAEFRRQNREWLRYSQMIAIRMHDRMDELGLTQKKLAEMMDCSQQYISKILKGKENLSLETLSKIESVLGIKIIHEFQQDLI
ncbi:MAG: helix-turn-helix transcriptional regulator [Bacteroidales bacterium]